MFRSVAGIVQTESISQTMAAVAQLKLPFHQKVAQGFSLINIRIIYFIAQTTATMQILA